MIEEDVLVAALELEESEVAEASRIADAVLTWVEGQTERHFREVQPFVGRFSGGAQDIWLPEKPTQVEGVPADLVVVESYDAGAWTAADADDYELIIHPRPYGAAVLQHATTGWPAGRRNIRVTYSAGYAVGELPSDIEQLVIEMTAQRWLDRGKENLRSETIGGYSYTRADGGLGELRKDWMDVITLWKHWAIA